MMRAPRRLGTTVLPRLAARPWAAVLVIIGALGSTAGGEPSEPLGGATSSPPATADGLALAQRVRIHRDAYGVPHIDAQDELAAVFGFAYAQAEDHFWQIEDSYILGLGRYAEVHGPRGLNSDLLNRAFEVASRSRVDFETLPPDAKAVAAAFTSGLNHYLAAHPGTTPRLIRRFEPWHALAFGRHAMLEMTYRYTRRNNGFLPRMHRQPWTYSGSNAWAVAPARTANGHAMLLVNPHQPWFGFGQLYEAHIRVAGAWNFSGAGMLGSVLPSLGHNEHLGWTFTTNEPDIADVWIETFDDPVHPLRYRYGDGYREAVQWQETIFVKNGRGLQPRQFTFRKTHHGPLIEKLDEQRYLAARISGLFECRFQKQLLAMMRARNLEQFRAALALLQFPLMNITYADRDGNIAFFYNGMVPRRNPAFDWRNPVDGSDPRTEWQGWHAFDELPAVINPPSHYVQNCNSCPFTTCDEGNPNPALFPSYLAEDRGDDRLRAKMSRKLLSQLQNATFEDLQTLAFDTTMYWPLAEFPRFEGDFRRLELSRPELARLVAPYWEHLQAWDYRATEESTAATLCEAWHRELHEGVYPGETYKPAVAGDSLEAVAARFQALLTAAAMLKLRHGDWRVPWGQVHRIQRHAQAVDLVDVPFDDSLPSLPCLGVPGPLGAIFTQYYTPAVRIPFVRQVSKCYGVVGTSYLAVYEFGPRVRGATLLALGQSGAADSPHFFDQAPLLSQRKLKPELFDWADVLRHAKVSYHPGEK